MSRKKNPESRSLATVSDCIFCGKPADSEEDAFPKWLIDRMDAWYKMAFESFGPPEEVLLERRICVGAETEIVFGTLKLGIRCVCRPCNNGWMSVIQNKHAKPIFTRLLEEPSLTLDLNECRSLTLWLVMTSMVLEALNPPEYWRFSEYERCLFWHGERIPDGLSIWIARWKNSHGPSVVGHLGAREGTPHKAVVTTIGFGTLALQLAKLNADIPLQSRPGPWDRCLVQVFPLQGNPICFPPPMEIEGYSGFEEMELRFSPPGTDPGPPSEEEIVKTAARLSRKFQRHGRPPSA